MNKIKLIVGSLILFILLSGFSPFSNKIKIDETKHLDILAQDIVRGLLDNSFVTIKENKNKSYILLEHKDFFDVYVRVYANSLLEKVQAIVFELPADSTFGVFEKNQYKISERLREFLRDSLGNLICNEDADFLKSGFECPDKYNVIYTVFEDQLNSFRNTLGLQINKQLYIQVLPLH